MPDAAVIRCLATLVIFFTLLSFSYATMPASPRSRITFFATVAAFSLFIDDYFSPLLYAMPLPIARYAAMPLFRAADSANISYYSTSRYALRLLIYYAIY